MDLKSERRDKKSLAGIFSTNTTNQVKSCINKQKTAYIKEGSVSSKYFKQRVKFWDYLW